MAAVSGTEMREIDRIAMEETGPGLAQMMENAGRSMAVLAIRTLGPMFEQANVLVLAGPGGNGGGGICAARHLAPRVDRVVVCLTEPDRLAPLTRLQLDLLVMNGGEVCSAASVGEGSAYDVVVDAIVGYGLVGAPRDAAGALIRWLNTAAARVLSLDLPSGLDADGGRAGADDIVHAECTLTLHMPKPGLQDPRAGRLFVADLGIPAAVTLRLGIDSPHYGPAFIAPLDREGRP
jgi:NAD(P)H-hydrate epimerase